MCPIGITKTTKKIEEELQAALIGTPILRMKPKPQIKDIYNAIQNTSH